MAWRYVPAHTREAARTCVSVALHFSFKCRLNPCRQGGMTPQYAARSQVSANPLSEAFGKGEHMVAVVYSTWRTGSCRGSFAGELPHSPQSQLRASQGHQAKDNAHFPEFQDVSLSVHGDVRACACEELQRAHEYPILFVSLHPRAQQHRGTKAPCSSHVAPGRSHQATMSQPLCYEQG